MAKLKIEAINTDPHCLLSELLGRELDSVLVIYREDDTLFYMNSTQNHHKLIADITIIKHELIDRFLNGERSDET